MIQLRNVSKSYPNGYVALKNLSLDVARGDMVFVTGPLGTGKTTLMKLLLAMEPITSGYVFVLGQKINNLSQRNVAKLRNTLGVILQDPLLLLEQTVFYNVAMPLRLAGYRRPAIQYKVETALDMVGLLPKAQLVTAMLSVGEQQLVNIARAMVGFPELILADEPFANLDTTLTHEIGKLLQRLNQLGVTLLITTHDRDNVLLQGQDYRVVTLE